MNQNCITNQRQLELKALFRSTKLFGFDFDGVMTDNSVYVAEDGTEFVKCSRFDGIGLEKIRSFGIPTIVISKEKNNVVKARCQKLRIEFIDSCNDKVIAMKQVLDRHGLSFKQAAFIGNDINDISLLKSVGLPIVVNDAHESIIHLGKYVTRRTGGNGAVREVCDLYEAYQTHREEG